MSMSASTSPPERRDRRLKERVQVTVSVSNSLVATRCPTGPLSIPDYSVQVWLFPKSAHPQPVTGGDISAAWRLMTSSGPVFVKTGPASSFDMFCGGSSRANGARGAGRYPCA